MRVAIAAARCSGAGIGADARAVTAGVGTRVLRVGAFVSDRAAYRCGANQQRTDEGPRDFFFASSPFFRDAPTARRWSTIVWRTELERVFPFGSARSSRSTSEARRLGAQSVSPQGTSFYMR